MEKSVSVNERCFIRSQACRRAFGGSGICFIACPSSNELTLEIEVMKSTLRDNGIEPYVAVENFEPGKDVFCEKICAKIIESQFCAVLLSDAKPPGEQKAIPNPNVYYEYGLMVAMHKTVIPLQKEDFPLAFNIQSLDTVSYNPKTLAVAFQTVLRKVLQESPDSVGTSAKHDCLGIFIRLSELKNKRFVEVTELPDNWASVLRNTVFKVRSGPSFVGDFTTAYSVNTVISETTILLNHLSNEIAILNNLIPNAPSEITQPTWTYPTTWTYPNWLTIKTKSDLEGILKVLQHTNIMLIIPNDWKSEVESLYNSLEHRYKPILELVIEQDVISQAIEAGLAPAQVH